MTPVTALILLPPLFSNDARSTSGIFGQKWDKILGGPKPTFLFKMSKKKKLKWGCGTVSVILLHMMIPAVISFIGCINSEFK